MLEDVCALLIDLDGLLYVRRNRSPAPRSPTAAARARAAAQVRDQHDRALTRSDAQELARLGLGVDDRELITPAALAVQHCRERGHHRVALIMNEEVKRDFKELQETRVIIIGDLGSAFGYDVLNHAFRQMIDGAELIALQKNR